MPYDLKKLTLIDNEFNVYAYYNDENTLSVCEITLIIENEWYINRVMVKHLRGNGLGSFLLKTCLNAIKNRPNQQIVRVTPNGYNEDNTKQCNFYHRNGFVPDERGIFYLKP